jgi:hypothetical protein
MTHDNASGKSQPDAGAELARMDAEFIRVLEDLIDVLVAKGVINLTDLPPQALDKLNRRRNARRRIRNALDLIPGDEDVI